MCCYYFSKTKSVQEARERITAAMNETLPPPAGEQPGAGQRRPEAGTEGAQEPSENAA